MSVQRWASMDALILLKTRRQWRAIHSGRRFHMPNKDTDVVLVARKEAGMPEAAGLELLQRVAVAVNDGRSVTSASQVCLNEVCEFTG